MDQMATLVSFGSAFVGLIAGYFVGYRSGQVAGELAALKSMQHRHGRDVSAHRSRRPSDDSQAASS
jgi:homogentisate 1,2-dioxygenase